MKNWLKKNLFNKIDENLIDEISGLKQIGKGAFNIRKNGQGVERQVTENINIVTKQDKPGIDIYVKENTKFEYVHIPVIITESGLNDLVYNDFYIGKNANVTIVLVAVFIMTITKILSTMVFIDFSLKKVQKLNILKSIMEKEMVMVRKF